MMSKQQKGSIIINPQTQRPVKIGSRTWLKLVRDGILEGEYEDPNELYTIQEGDDVDEKIKEINENLPLNVQSVRGRGKYKNKIVKRHKQPSTTETTRYTVKKTAQKIKNREIYEDLQENGNFEADLEALIMEELMKTNFDEKEEEDTYNYEVKDNEKFNTDLIDDDDYEVEYSEEYEYSE